MIQTLFSASYKSERELQAQGTPAYPSTEAASMIHHEQGHLDAQSSQI